MSWDSIWENIFQQKDWGKYPSENLIQFMARNFYHKDRKNTIILEVGCGPGANIWYLAKEGFDAYGIDGSKTAIENAKKRLSSEDLNAHFDIGDIINLPYNNNYFDAVIDNECIYCNSKKNSELILERIRKILKKSGLFYSRTFASEMYVGKNQRQVGYHEYTDISDGPFHGKGFVRLIDRKEIDEFYGKYFAILSVDKLEYTYNNGAVEIKEWIIISKKREF